MAVDAQEDVGPAAITADAAPQRQIADMTGSAALPRKNGELVFDDAWQGRAFGMTVAMSHDRQFEWREFQARLIAEIGRAERDGERSSYYDRWLAAFERLLVDKGLVAPGELARRTEDFASGRRDDVF
jgi:nitrile hydratase accessory protein